MEELKYNFGLDLKLQEEHKARESNLQFGAVQNKTILQNDGQYTNFDPECEIQKTDYDDLMNCVTQSRTNVFKILLKKQFNIDINQSQRFSSKMSGTTRQGNSLYNVADSARHDGFVEEEVWPWRRDMTWDEYYSPIFTSVKNRGLKTVQQFDVSYESVPTNPAALKDALRYAPLQVIGYAWILGNDGLYHSNGYRANHAFTLVGYVEGQYWIVYDSYPTDYQIDENSTKQEFIKHLAWDYQFGDAMLYSIKLKATDKQSWLIKIMTKFTKICRDTVGGLWFVKIVEKDGVKFTGKQKIEDWLSAFGAIVDEVGCSTKSDEELNKALNYKFFGK